MTRVRSFPAIADRKCRVLILGSMPGIRSLTENQYYAHPQNQFWRIVAAVTGAPPGAPYDERAAALLAKRIALWDVLQSCMRKGSLDSAITDEAPNDFAEFFSGHPGIRHVFFNGGKAEQSFRRYVLPAIDTKKLALARLPSTSPAHAGMNFEKKLAAWQAALRRALE